MTSKLLLPWHIYSFSRKTWKKEIAWETRCRKEYTIKGCSANEAFGCSPDYYGPLAGYCEQENDLSIFVGLFNNAFSNFAPQPYWQQYKSYETIKNNRYLCISDFSYK